MDLNTIGSTALSVPEVLGHPINLGKTPADQRRAVAGQFEAILLRQFLTDSVGAMMGGKDSTQGSIYGYLLGDVMSQQLAAGGGFGLAKLIDQQLTPVKPPVTLQAKPPAGDAAAKGVS